MKNVFKKRSLFSSKGLFLFMWLSATFAQEKPVDSLKITELKAVMVTAVRATDKNPITFINVSKTEIAPRNLGQDVPVLLQYLPSVVTTTDAGNGVGYTAMRVRGADGSRINVTLNGIPFNDSESQGTFFVNLPDFASSLESVQLQRGVGTSTNGAGAFGASLNMQTKSFQEKSYAAIANSMGSFGTRKHTLAFGTGLHNNLEINGRVSNIASDGYVDRAFSKMFGYFFNANYLLKNGQLKALAFGGKEQTYQAWYGLEDPEKLKNDRTYNPAGMYTDANGNTQFYDNETDNYWQNHFQLHWIQEWGTYWTSTSALHYTLGKGYFEQYKEDQELSEYYLPVNQGNTISDIVRKRWLDNAFFGATFALDYKKDKTTFLFGGAANRYLGKHFGEVVWTPTGIPNFNRYYDNFGNKDEVSVYSKFSQSFAEKWNLFADVQYRMVFYEATSTKFNLVNDTFRFINPKAGIGYKLHPNSSLYGYFGIANKEPRRDDYENGSIQPERLFDYELGWKFSKNNTKLNVNLFYMNYINQMVMTGALNDVGSPIFTNSGKSYRVGLEIEAQLQLHNNIILRPNITLSENRNQEFITQRNGVLQDLGAKQIAFSPRFIFGNQLQFLPFPNAQLSLFSKYVGTQYMGNTESEVSKLNAFFVSDLVVNYEWKPNKGIKSIVFSGMLNNFLNEKYESNGYFYMFDDTWTQPGSTTTIEGAGFYPQAGRNFLLGLELQF